MDGARFDRMTRRAARLSRRRVVAAAVGCLAALGGRGATTRVAASPVLVYCSGIAGLPCPPGYECVDDPSDGCDPALGGADCWGVCRPTGLTNPCAAILCAEGTHCCPQCGGICVEIGIACDQFQAFCAETRCGPNWCGPGEWCCNESCGSCVPLGSSCTEEFCGGEPCGTTVCRAGEYCCNPSCSICAPFGGGCITQVCEEPAGEPCGPTVCAAGEVCCNASCGICTPPDGFCIQVACV